VGFGFVMSELGHSATPPVVVGAVGSTLRTTIRSAGNAKVGDMAKAAQLNSQRPQYPAAAVLKVLDGAR
jgi:hypothetical protein